MTTAELLRTIRLSREDLDRCVCDLLISDIRREPYEDRQTSLVAKLLRNLASTMHNQWAAEYLTEAATNLESLAKDLEDARFEREEERDKYMLREINKANR